MNELQQLRLSWTSTFQILDATQVNHSSNTEHYLDYILHDPDSSDMVVACNTYKAGNFNSDHVPFVCKVKIPGMKVTKRFFRRHGRAPLQAASRVRFAALISSVWSGGRALESVRVGETSLSGVVRFF